MASRWRTETGSEINLAPLLDVIFCLLFFFILATSLRRERQALELELPRGGLEARTLEESLRLNVDILKDGALALDGERLDPEALEARLSELPRKTPGGRQRELVIRSDAAAQVQDFVSVTDICARAGWPAARMETLPAEEESR